MQSIHIAPSFQNAMKELTPKARTKLQSKKHPFKFSSKEKKQLPLYVLVHVAKDSHYDRPVHFIAYIKEKGWVCIL